MQVVDPFPSLLSICYKASGNLLYAGAAVNVSALTAGWMGVLHQALFGVRKCSSSIKLLGDVATASEPI